MEFTAHGTWNMYEKKRGVKDDCILEPFERIEWGRKDQEEQVWRQEMGESGA